jgi:TolB-like protein
MRIYEKISPITVSLVCLILGVAGCSSQPAVPHHSANAPQHRAADQSEQRFFRHRWWNFYQRGVDYAERGAIAEALADFTMAIGQRENDQRMARTYGMHFIDYFPSREMGVLYYEMGRYREAQEALERSITSYPSAKATFYLDQVRRAIIQKSGQFIAPPQLELDTLGQELWTREAPVIVAGTAWDDHYVERVLINSDPVYQEGSQKRFAFQAKLHLTEGSHRVIIEAANLMGKTTRQTMTINVDRRGPLILVEQIRPDLTVKGGTHAVSVMITDPAGISALHLNGVPMTVHHEPTVRFQYRLPVDAKEIRVDAVDRVGNSTNARLGVEETISLARHPILLAMADSAVAHGLLASQVDREDRKAPEIVLKDWTDNQTVYLEKVFIDGAVRDMGDVVEVAINGEPIFSGSAKVVYFNNIVPLAEGINTLVVTSIDRHGNTSEKRLTIERKIPAALNIDARLRVSVLPFEVQGDRSAASASFQTQLLDALFRRNRFQLVERRTLDAILKEQNLSQTDLIDSKSAIRVGRLAAAESVIAGDIIETRQGIEVVSRMIDTESTEILAMEDVYSDAKDMQSLQTLANGMAIKYHRDFPLVDGIVVSKQGGHIITDLGEQKIKRQRRILIYKESPIHHPSNGRLLGIDKLILCRARITTVEPEISKAKLVDEPSAEVRTFHKVITE